MAFRFMFRLFLDICWLRKGPQDIPVGQGLMLRAGIAYVILGLVLGDVTQSMGTAWMEVLLDLVLLVLFVKLVLTVKSKPARFEQTLTAFLGSGAIITLCAVPVFWLINTSPEGASLPVLLWLGLFLWNLAISGHILRHALEVSMPVGVVIAAAYLIVAVNVVALALPSP